MNSFKKLWKICLCSLVIFSAVSMMGCSSKSGAKDGEGGLSEADLNAQRDARFAGGGIPTAEGEGMFRDVTFAFDSSKVDDQGQSDIQFNVKVLRENPEIKVQLEGHCDERGTAEYNLALGAERARAVKEVLISLGVPAASIDTISYGEEVPLDAGHSEAAWARNRRVHFSPFASAAKR